MGVDTLNHSPLPRSAVAGGFAGNYSYTRGQSLPDVPEGKPPGEPWRLVGIQPQTNAKAELVLVLQLAAPDRDYVEYRRSIQGAAAELAGERDAAYASFLTETPEGQRLVRVRAAHAEAKQLLAETMDASKQHESAIRAAITSGKSPEAAEQALRRAINDIEIYHIRLDVTSEALSLAEFKARHALRERMAGVRQAAIKTARAAFDDAAAELAAAVSEIGIALAVGVARLTSAQTPIAGQQLQLPG